MYHAKIITTPVGELTLIATDRGLSAILWENEGAQRVPLKPIARNDQHPILCEAERQLRQYFAGERQQFDMPYDTVGTAFQKRSGRRCSPFRLVKPAAICKSRSRSATRKRYAPSGLPMVKIRCRSWRPVIALSAATVSSPALLAAWR